MKITLQSILIAGVFAAPFAAVAQHAPETAVITAVAPGKVAMGEVMQVQGKIKSVDKANRVVVVVGPHGNEVAVNVGPEVKNFNQIAAGDVVTLTMAQAVLGAVKKVAPGALRERIESQQAVKAPLGEKPAGAVERTVVIVADVVAINAKAQTVTLRGPRRSVEVGVNDPTIIAGLKIGDQVEAHYVEAVALEVSAAKR